MFGIQSRTRTSPLRGIIVAVVALAAALVLSSCGKVAEKATEKATERIIESVDGIDDVQIDSDSGEVTVKNSDGGTMTISGEGEEFSYTGESEEGDFEFKSGGNQSSVPEWFPSEIPLPDSYKVVSSGRQKEGELTTMVVMLETHTSPENIASSFKKEMANLGWESVVDTETTARDFTRYMIAFEKDGENVSITTGQGGEADSTIVNYTMAMDIG